MKTPYKPTAIPIKKLDWESLIPRIGMAQAAVARFDGILQAMVNPELLLSPLTTQEAVLSSKIEGTQASLEDVLQYDVAPRADAEHRDDIQEVQNYREAMRKAVGWLKKSGLSAERLLPQLESAGILTIAEPGSGSRPTVFVFKRLLAITEQREGF